MFAINGFGGHFFRLMGIKSISPEIYREHFVAKQEDVNREHLKLTFRERNLRVTFYFGDL